MMCNIRIGQVTSFLLVCRRPFTFINKWHHWCFLWDFSTKPNNNNNSYYYCYFHHHHCHHQPVMPPLADGLYNILHSTRSCAIFIQVSQTFLQFRSAIFSLVFLFFVCSIVGSIQLILDHLLFCILSTRPTHFLFRSFAVWMTSLTCIISLMIMFLILSFDLMFWMLLLLLSMHLWTAASFCDWFFVSDYISAP